MWGGGGGGGRDRGNEEYLALSCIVGLAAVVLADVVFAWISNLIKRNRHIMGRSWLYGMAGQQLYWYTEKWLNLMVCVVTARELGENKDQVFTVKTFCFGILWCSVYLIYVNIHSFSQSVMMFTDCIIYHKTYLSHTKCSYFIYLKYGLD